jgi:hypothetical protein
VVGEWRVRQLLRKNVRLVQEENGRHLLKPVVLEDGLEQRQRLLQAVLHGIWTKIEINRRKDHLV